MQVLALSRRAPGVTAQDLAPYATAEARAAHTLVAAGVIRSAHLCPERPGSALVLECDSVEEAHLQLAALPMVRAGLIAFELTRMLPYTGYSVLFRPEAGAASDLDQGTP